MSRNATNRLGCDLRLGVKQGVFDRAQPLADDTAGGEMGQAVELGVNPLMFEGGLSDNALREPLDDGADAGRTKALFKLAPADDKPAISTLDGVKAIGAEVRDKRFAALKTNVFVYQDGVPRG
jgi:hypothetical protein